MDPLLATTSNAQPHEPCQAEPCKRTREDDREGTSASSEA
jgi:hypothetical protein